MAFQNYGGGFPQMNLGLSYQELPEPEIGLAGTGPAGTGGSIYTDPQLPSQVSPMGDDGVDWGQIMAMASQAFGGPGGGQGQQAPSLLPAPGIVMPPQPQPVPLTQVSGLFGLRG